MSQSEAAFPVNILDKLRYACADPAVDLSQRLGQLQRWIADDMAWVDSELVAGWGGGSLVDKGARHLLGLSGKRLRPMCVVLAAKMGSGFSEAARDLAVAAELIHNATLLHDDVIDQGQLRRGAPAARVIYGNTASVLAGDSLLVAALQRVQRTGHAALLRRALQTIESMISAEAIQLENRRRINPSREDYFSVVEGKTASLFRWALFSGGVAGDLDTEACRALEVYGASLGVSFQLVDDLLDLTTHSTSGKAPFNDLSQGRMTYPLVLALERDPDLLPLLETAFNRREGEPLPQLLVSRLLHAVGETEALADCLTLARAHTRQAVESIQALPGTPARDALITTAKAMVCRRS